MGRDDLERRLDRALRHLRRDPRLRPLIRQHGRPSWRRNRTVFETLCGSILHQQLSGKAARTIQRRFLALLPERPHPTPERVLTLSVDELRGAGVSERKASYLLELAEHFCAGRVEPRAFRSLDDDELRDELTRIRGVGPWTVDMLMIFTLHRLDVLPVGDLGIQKGMQRLHELEQIPDAASMVELAEPWRPYRSVASWYLWRVADGGL